MLRVLRCNDSLVPSSSSGADGERRGARAPAFGISADHDRDSEANTLACAMVCGARKRNLRFPLHLPHRLRGAHHLGRPLSADPQALMDLCQGGAQTASSPHASSRSGGSPADLMNRSAARLDFGDNAAVRPTAPAEAPHGFCCHLPRAPVAPRRGPPPGRGSGDDPRQLRGDRRPLPIGRYVDSVLPSSVTSRVTVISTTAGTRRSRTSGSICARTRPSGAPSSATMSASGTTSRDTSRTRARREPVSKMSRPEPDEACTAVAGPQWAGHSKRRGARQVSGQERMRIRPRRRPAWRAGRRGTDRQANEPGARQPEHQGTEAEDRTAGDGVRQRG